MTIGAIVNRFPLSGTEQVVVRRALFQSLLRIAIYVKIGNES